MHFPDARHQSRVSTAPISLSILFTHSLAYILLNNHCTAALSEGSCSHSGAASTLGHNMDDLD